MNILRVTFLFSLFVLNSAIFSQTNDSIKQPDTSSSFIDGIETLKIIEFLKEGNNSFSYPGEPTFPVSPKCCETELQTKIFNQSEPGKKYKSLKKKSDSDLKNIILSHHYSLSININNNDFDLKMGSYDLKKGGFFIITGKHICYEGKAHYYKAIKNVNFESLPISKSNINKDDPDISIGDYVLFIKVPESNASDIESNIKNIIFKLDYTITGLTRKRYTHLTDNMVVLNMDDDYLNGINVKLSLINDESNAIYYSKSYPNISTNK